MRSIKELLELMLNNINKLKTGLCGLAAILQLDGIISSAEYVILYKYFKCNQPLYFINLVRKNKTKHDYYWKIGNIPYRIKYLKKHIKLNTIS